MSCKLSLLVSVVLGLGGFVSDARAASPSEVSPSDLPPAPVAQGQAPAPAPVPVPVPALPPAPVAEVVEGAIPCEPCVRPCDAQIWITCGDCPASYAPVCDITKLCRVGCAPSCPAPACPAPCPPVVHCAPTPCPPVACPTVVRYAPAPVVHYSLAPACGPVVRYPTVIHHSSPVVYGESVIYGSYFAP